MRYKVVESFISINGEGARAGQLAVFVRFAGCNLQCSYCDTMWANLPDTQYQEMTAQAIYQKILDTGISNVTLTGGEPLLQEGIEQLLVLLTSDNTLRVEIETNGSVDLKSFRELQPAPIFTMDYKLGSSNMKHRMLLSNFEDLKPHDTVKFVVGCIEDLETAHEIIKKYTLTDRCGVHISPVFGKIDLQEIVEFMKHHRMNAVRLQPQLHKIIWHPDTKGV